MSGCPPGATALPPNSTGICAAYPGSALLAVVTTGVVVPSQLPLKFFRLLPGAGIDPPDCRSTICPYQLPLMLLLLNAQLSADWTGILDPSGEPPSRNSTPTVQLSVMKFSVTIKLSVWLRIIMPVRLSVIRLLRTVCPPELLMSMPVRRCVIRLLRMIMPVNEPWMETPAVFNPGLFQSTVLLPSRVTVNPSSTTPFATKANVEPDPPIGPDTIDCPA